MSTLKSTIAILPALKFYFYKYFLKKKLLFLMIFNIIFLIEPHFLLKKN